MLVVSIVTDETENEVPLIRNVAADVPVPVAVMRISNLVQAVLRATVLLEQLAVVPFPVQYLQ